MIKNNIRRKIKIAAEEIINICFQIRLIISILGQNTKNPGDSPGVFIRLLIYNQLLLAFMNFSNSFFQLGVDSVSFFFSSFDFVKSIHVVTFVIKSLCIGN